MAQSKRAAKTPEEAKAKGLSTIHDFFKAAPKKDRRAASPKVDKSRRIGKSSKQRIQKAE